MKKDKKECWLEYVKENTKEDMNRRDVKSINERDARRKIERSGVGTWSVGGVNVGA
jgi:hypothetical protein